jgi:hypothetical protein
MVRRAILRVAFLAEEVLAISQLSFGCRRSVVGLERAGRSNCVIDAGCVFQGVLT